MKKLLASDYDGTFYRSDNEVMENIKAVNQFRNRDNLFVIATGRSYESFLEHTKDFSINIDYLILCNGALILDNNEKYLIHYSLENKIIVEINETVERYKQEIQKITYVSKFKNYDEYNQKIEVIKIKLAISRERTVYQLSELIKNKIKSVNAYVIPLKEGYLLEIITNLTNKARAIEYIRLKESVAIENVLTIGDSGNDLEMIESYNGYAIATAHKDLSKYISKKIDSVNTLANNN